MVVDMMASCDTFTQLLLIHIDCKTAWLFKPLQLVSLATVHTHHPGMEFPK